ncbi:MAG: cobalamin-binding protein [Acidobacteria bacterium]|nr:MAG: cobalamin-binding protein [Acidobacteriota bacterium]
MRNAKRICSLLPSATEIVAALGCLDRLVGRSAECDFPPSVARLPVVTSARIDTADLDSAAIDGAVRAALADGRSLYAVDGDLVTRLAPDLILTQDLCEVCAVSSSDESLCATAIETLALDAHTIGGIEETVLELGARLGVQAHARAVVDAIELAIRETSARVGDLPRRRAFVCEWLDPPFAAGHWVPEMVTAAGGVAVLGQAAIPDLGCPVVAVDANAYFSRPAPRVADGVRQLAHLFHPEAVPDPGLPYVELSRADPARVS